MSKVIKQMEMNSLKDTFKGVRDMVVLSTKGLSSLGDYTFRAMLRKKKIRLKVVKNSLASRVFEDLGLNVPAQSPYWAGPTTFVWGGASIAEVCREVEGELGSPKNASQYKDKVSIKGAIADGQPMPFDVAKKLPTREEAIARVLMLAMAPASRLVSQITGPAAALSSQLKSIEEKKQETPAA